MTKNYITIGALAISLLYVDLFCGAGGTSTGIEQAKINGQKCAKVIACVNHDKNAIISHAENHPETLHFTEDIRTLNVNKDSELVLHVAQMRKTYPFAKLSLWGSIDCTNHSNAKGGMSRDADSRTLAHHMNRYVAALNPDCIQIENVREFLDWGPLQVKKLNGETVLCKKGNPIMIPVKEEKGRDYKIWKQSIEVLGYDYDHRILNSADFGAYTSRRRLFIQFAKPGFPIVWPEPTHHKTAAGNLAKWKACREVLDLEKEGKSIFEGKAKVEKTLERVYAGLVKFVADGEEEFVSAYYSGDADLRNKSLDVPLGVVTTNNRFAKVKATFLSKYFSGNPSTMNIPVDAPAGSITTVDHHSLVVTDFLSAYYGSGDNVSSVESPAPTVTTKDRLAKVNMTFIDQQFGQSKPASINQPLGTIACNPNFAKVDVSCFLMNPQYQSKGGSVEAPCFTLIARMDKMPPYIIQLETGEIAIEIYETDSPMTVKIKRFMAAYGIIDIKMRMLFDYELKQIQGFPLDYVLVGTQAEVKKYIGNSVEVRTARALCEASARIIIETRKAA